MVPVLLAPPPCAAAVRGIRTATSAAAILIRNVISPPPWGFKSTRNSNGITFLVKHDREDAARLRLAGVAGDGMHFARLVERLEEHLALCERRRRVVVDRELILPF